MITLALDQSTTCVGWSIFENGVYKNSGYYEVEGKKDKKLINIHNFIIDICNKYKVDYASIEDIWLNETVKNKSPFNSTKGFGDNVLTHKRLGELFGACKIALYRVGVKRVVTIPPVSWKSYFKLLGKGKSRDIQKELSKTLSSEIKGKILDNDDEADSILMNKFLNYYIFTNEDTGEDSFKLYDDKNNRYFPEIYYYFTRKDYEFFSKKYNIKLEREKKEIIGTTDTGKNKWKKEIISLLASDLDALTSKDKAKILESLKTKITDDLKLKIINKNLEKITGGK